MTHFIRPAWWQSLTWVVLVSVLGWVRKTQ